MTFYSNRLAAGAMIGLSLLNVCLATVRFQRHGSHDKFALVQMVTWMLVLAVWSWIGSTRWWFTPKALEQRRLVSRAVTVPYDEIISVDPISSGKAVSQFVIVYGSNAFSQRRRRLAVNPDKRPDFLAELERRAPHATFNV